MDPTAFFALLDNFRIIPKAEYTVADKNKIPFLKVAFNQPITTYGISVGMTTNSENDHATITIFIDRPNFQTFPPSKLDVKVTVLIDRGFIKKNEWINVSDILSPHDDKKKFISCNIKNSQAIETGEGFEFVVLSSISKNGSPGHMIITLGITKGKNIKSDNNGKTDDVKKKRKKSTS